jgi:hypothetical protein
MAGIFPDGGVHQSVNTINDPQIKAACDALWFALSCRTNFDPAQSNAIISELLNAMEQSNVTYDCTELDNLAAAMRIHAIEYIKRIPLPVEPWLVKNGSHTVAQGSFTVPNTYNRPITCLVTSMLIPRIQQIANASPGRCQLDTTLSSDGSFSDNLIPTSIITNSGSGDNRITVSFENVKNRFLTIQPNGTTFWYKIVATGSADDLFNLFTPGNDDNILKYLFYGVSAHTHDRQSD